LIITPDKTPPINENVITHKDDIPNNSKKAIRIAISNEIIPEKTVDRSVALGTKNAMKKRTNKGATTRLTTF
jgi:hypothetical protein